MLSCIALYRYVSASLPCVLFDCFVYALRLCFLSCVAFDCYLTTRCLVLRLIDTLLRSVCVVFVISYYFELYFQQFVPCSIKSISKPARVVVNRTGTVVSIRRTRFVLNCE